MVGAVAWLCWHLVAVVLAVVTSGCDGSGGIAPVAVETSNHVVAVTATAATGS